MTESFDDALPAPDGIVAPPRADFRNAPRQKSPLPAPDRLPPHAIEAEQGVLGCILLSPHDSLPQCIDRFPAGDEVFYDLRHQTIYANLLQMLDNRKQIDVITLMQRLKDLDLLDQIGGIAYLNELQNLVPSAANVTYYTDIIEEKWILRKIIATHTRAVARVYDFEGDVAGLLDETEREILAIAQSRERKESFVQMRRPVQEAITLIEAMHARQGEITGLKTGFPDLDRMTDGLHGGEMWVIAARPSMGKTSLAMNITENIVLNQRIPVAVFSLEMTKTSLALRSVSSNARVNMRNVRDGYLTEADFPKLTASAGRLSGAPLYIDDTPSLSILQLRSRARRAAQQWGIKLFVVDYLQLVQSTSQRARNREQEIADISAGVKAIAKELNVPVIVLAQLNREIEREKNRKPRLADLRESGSLEQDADVVGMLYKPSNEHDDNDDGMPVNLLIAKQRSGPTGDVHLTFLKAYTRFESAARVSDNDVPDEQKQFPT